MPDNFLTAQKIAFKDKTDIIGDFAIRKNNPKFMFKKICKPLNGLPGKPQRREGVKHLQLDKEHAE
jgi:hypothetical protein